MNLIIKVLNLYIILNFKCCNSICPYLISTTSMKGGTTKTIQSFFQILPSAKRLKCTLESNDEIPIVKAELPLRVINRLAKSNADSVNESSIEVCKSTPATSSEIDISIFGNDFLEAMNLGWNDVLEPETKKMN